MSRLLITTSINSRYHGSDLRRPRDSRMILFKGREFFAAVSRGQIEFAKFDLIGEKRKKHNLRGSWNLQKLYAKVARNLTKGGNEGNFHANAYSLLRKATPMGPSRWPGTRPILEAEKDASRPFSGRSGRRIKLLSSMFRVACRIFTACNRLPSTLRSLSLLWRNPATPVVRRLVLADVHADRRTARI